MIAHLMSLQRFSYRWGPDYEKIIESILAANEDNYQPRFDQKKDRLIISACKSNQVAEYPELPMQIIILFHIMHFYFKKKR